jgi:hypothetical protein
VAIRNRMSPERTPPMNKTNVAVSARNTMRGHAARLAFVLALGLGAAAAAAAQPANPAGVHGAAGFAPGRILLMPRPGLPPQALDRIVAAHAGKAHRVGRSGLHIVELPAGSEAAAVQALSRHPHIKFAELDRRVAAGFAANDPYAGSEWHLARIGAGAAWDLAQGAGVTIAILDSGVDGTHPDLAQRMVPGWNFIDNNANTADVNGHGTAVAGAAAASSNNALGVASVAGQARLMPLRIADANAYAYWSTVAQGLTWAADHGARVANISYVGVAGSSAVRSAAQYMKGKGGLVVVCAGNNGIDEAIAPTTSMIPVAATDAADALTSWSSYGQFVAMSAPGLDIWTTVRGGGYQAWWGTSLASPLTAGVLALMMSADPALPNTQIESLLYATALDLGASGRDARYGYGRLDAAAAVRAVAAGIRSADTQPPVVALMAPAPGATLAGLASIDVSASDDVAVARVELRVHGAVVASDALAPFGFSWDTSSVPNGQATLAAVAYDAAGNAAGSAAVTVNVANAPVLPTDTAAPSVAIVSPSGGTVKGTVSITTQATDNAGAAGITQMLYIDGSLKASAKGASLGYNWNSRKSKSGTHEILVNARDTAGNTSTTILLINN